MNIGETIRRLRREQGMTQEALAEALNISPQAVSRWELNLAMPDITLLPALACLFDVTSDELLGIRTPLQQQRLRDTFVQAQRLREGGQSGAAAMLLRAALARTLPHLWESREMLLADLSAWDSQERALRRAVMDCLALACRKIQRAAVKGHDAKALIASGLPPPAKQRLIPMSF